MTETGEKPEIQWVHQRPGGTKSKTGLESNVDDGVAFALRVVIEYSDKGLPETTTLAVNSPHLLRILKSIVNSHPSLSTDFESPFEMAKPYQLFYHYWDEIHAAYGNDDITDEERMHLKLLLKFMEQEMGQDKQRVEAMGRSGRITFATLWTIFRPGDLAYIPDDSGHWLLQLSRIAYDENKKIGKYMDVYCLYNDYDGSRFGQTEHLVRIIQKINFPGEEPSPIQSLPIFPLSWFTGEAELEEKLAERGERFCAVQRERVKYHNGIAWHVKEIPLDWFDPAYNDAPSLWEPYTVSQRPFYAREQKR